MSQPIPIPEMRPFVMSLLTIAAGDKHKVPTPVNIASNATLRYSFELVGKVPVLARSAQSDPSWDGWLASDPPAEEFFVFCGRLLDAVDQRVRGRHRILPPKDGDQPSSYDHAAHLALGQTLAYAVGVKRGKFPPLRECFLKLASTAARRLQQRFLTNYLGNILHDYFDAAQVRAEFASLPPDFEDSLRVQEGASLAATVLALAEPASSEEPVSFAAVEEKLAFVIGQVWLKEGALDDKD